MQIKTKVRGGPRSCGGPIIYPFPGPYNPSNPYEQIP